MLAVRFLKKKKLIWGLPKDILALFSKCKSNLQGDITSSKSEKEKKKKRENRRLKLEI